MNFLFWNINGKDLKQSIAALASEYAIDIIILAESPFKTELLLELNKSSTNFYPQNPLSQCDKIQIYTRFHYDFIKPIHESNRLSIRKLNLPLKEPILLTALHVVDKSNHSAESLSETASLMIREITSIEEQEGNYSNILVGDFNMNPFEIGLIKSNGFNASMSRSIAIKEFRTVQERSYRYLYNPMWSLYGDLFDEPSGTYFYPNAELVNYQWNIFDQVLLRPSLIPKFDKTSLKVITHDLNSSFLTASGIPDKKIFSDHLPIKFTLNL